ncbi:lambda exonuclease family protein [Methylobacterium organophilum]|uniref:YqaJ viral recombinase domain-containing protein n=1 Tax=Methylobacterium organophilum TaxID=410 RepID=A0ABQ4T6K0_METOR|nr:lambda exonuclease family protein [Methylobacterium organophilum]GJE26267.1 hypothetical protein LKMONMHP_1116 [Methylobacterium organophilum]
MSEMVQGSAEWLAARIGRLTASRAADVVAKTLKGTPKAERERYLMELVAERLTGLTAPHYVSAEMLWGSEQEPAACFAYEFFTDLDTAKIGFVPHPTIAMFGASPDRLVGEEGLVEFKCPTTRTHLETVLSGVIPPDHFPQLDAQLACCPGCQWVDFVSYDPRLPDDMRLFVRRVLRSDRAEAIAKLEDEARIFLAEVDARIERIADACRPQQEAA